MTSRRAYPLIVILIVLALLSLIGAIAIPNLGIINSIKEKQEFNELRRDLMYLRNKAIMENSYYEVNIDIKENRYRLGISSHLSSVKSKTLKSGLKFIKTEDGKADVFKFSRSGSPSKASHFIIQ